MKSCSFRGSAFEWRSPLLMSRGGREFYGTGSRRPYGAAPFVVTKPRIPPSLAARTQGPSWAIFGGPYGANTIRLRSGQALKSCPDTPEGQEALRTAGLETGGTGFGGLERCE